MPTKKVFVAAGLVCVLAPAALAMMNRVETAGREPSQPAVQVLLNDYLKKLENLLARGNEAGAEEQATDGQVSLPFTRSHWVSLADVIAADLDKFEELSGVISEDILPVDDIAMASVPVVPASAGPVGGGAAAANQQGGQSSGKASSGGFLGGGGITNPNARAGFGAARAGSAAGGSGSGASGGSAPNGLALTGELPGGGASEDPGLMAMPLPASVWMLMAAIAGLGVLGYRRSA